MKIGNMLPSKAFFIAAAFVAIPFGVIEAKPGGCKGIAGHCAATFELTPEVAKVLGQEEVRLYLGQTGFAAFTGVPTYKDYDIREALAQDTVPLHWEVNRCFAGNFPEWGIIRSSVQSSPDGTINSRTFVMKQDFNSASLYPARVLHSLHFSIEFPKLGMTIVNRDPVVMSGQARALDIQKDILADQRVTGNPDGKKGIPQSIMDIMAGEVSFAPMGEYKLIKPVDFYDARNPKVKIATLTDGTFINQPHWGLQIRYLGTKKAGEDFGQVLFEISNISGKPQQVNWYVEDAHDLSITGIEFKIPVAPGQTPAVSRTTDLVHTTMVDKDPLYVTVNVANLKPSAPLGADACIFCGAQNAPKDLNAFKTEFVSDFAVVSRKQFQQPFMEEARPGAAPEGGR